MEANPHLPHSISLFITLPAGWLRCPQQRDGDLVLLTFCMFFLFLNKYHKVIINQINSYLQTLACFNSSYIQFTVSDSMKWKTNYYLLTATWKQRWSQSAECLCVWWICCEKVNYHLISGCHPISFTLISSDNLGYSLEVTSVSSNT